ncbi:MAG TPA: sigma-70 family RNA polymerase sigma factor, partial [Iamia sp.]
ETGSSAFDELYRADWHAVVALGWSLTGSRAVAEELAQDAFLDAYRRWDHVGSLDRPGAWVRRAVANRAVSHRRHLRVVEAGAQRLTTAARVAQDAAASPPDTDPDFWTAVRALPERQAQTIALHYLEDLGIEDIAVLLAMRASTVRVHLSRGRRALARTLSTIAPEEDA